ncbi:MAG: hypothetical protein AAB885_02325, partial [Patescibacteria group bacterium]
MKGLAMTATLNQAAKILELFKETPNEQIQAILGSGLLTDLRDANISKINREDYRRVCGLKPPIPTFTLTIDPVSSFVAKEAQRFDLKLLSDSDQSLQPG